VDGGGSVERGAGAIENKHQFAMYIIFDIIPIGGAAVTARCIDRALRLLW